MNHMPVTGELLSGWSDAYRQSPTLQVAAMALSKTDLNDVMFVSDAAWRMQQKFSVDLKTLPVTNQQHSGRCWLFAATNVLRERIAQKLNLGNFELSQSWLAFWDKFERCNYFLESMLETASLPCDDRVVQFILQTGVHDGGQWDMFANIVRKYGVVPKDVYGERHQSGNTQAMNRILNRAMTAGAIRLRGMVAAGESDEAVQTVKNELLGKAYGFLCACYGEPVQEFDFEYVDKDDSYHCEAGMTPRTFTEKYVGGLLDEIVSVINAPTDDKPYHRTFTIRMLGNVVGGREVRHLNLPMDEFKAAIIRQLESGKVVWFGSDVGKWGERQMGIWDDACFGAERFTGFDLAISKKDSLDYCFAAMNHAMVITGVNLKDGKPTRWKIENSWGDERGVKGYYVCSDTWFDQYVFQAAIEKEYLGDSAALADQAPIVLEPWDPMGTLAE